MLSVTRFGWFQSTWCLLLGVYLSHGGDAFASYGIVFVDGDLFLSCWQFLGCLADIVCDAALGVG